MASSVATQAETFVRSYSKLFSSPSASSPEHVAELAEAVGRHYRPGMTMFTNGKISRFESQSEAAKLIENEMRSNIASGLGTKLVLDKIERVQVYSETSALCWLTWSFHPRAGSEFEGRAWTFTNIYGYRAAAAAGGVDTEDDLAEGWEFVVRDQEVNEFRRVTGTTFEV